MASTGASSGSGLGRYQIATEIDDQQPVGAVFIEIT
jgi:hypothetical protein